MTDETLGLRIAERRKLLGLSQEAFGEKMGVSRQAISKWEADAAVPEIDKLIAMSKLFGVTLGWLLGTEENATSDALSEKQLQMVEELVKKYSQRQPPEAKKNPIWMILIAVFLVIAMLLAGNAALSTGALREELSWQSNMLYNRYNDISDQLYQLEKGLEDVAASDRLLTEYALQVQPVEGTTDLLLQLTALPGTWTQGDRAWLSLRVDSEEKVKGECSFDGNALTAQFPIPMAKSYDPYLIILRSDGSQQQQVLRKTVLDDLYSYAHFQLQWGCDQMSWSSREAKILDIWLDLQPPRIFPEAARWEQAALLLCINGQTKQTYSLLPLGEDPRTLFQVEQPDIMHYVVTCDIFCLDAKELGLKTGDVVSLELQGSLTSGHSFQQTLWTFRKTEPQLEGDMHQP